MSNIVTVDSGFLLFFGTYFFEVQTFILLTLLLCAIAYDVRWRRIPNALILTGLALGIGYHTLTPYGFGLMYAVKGIAVPLVLLLPLYLIRAMGAGDVKLMMTSGAFLGAGDVFAALLFTFVAGGALAIAGSIWRGNLGAVLRNVRFIVTGAAINAMAGGSLRLTSLPSAGKLPYAAAIAVGVCVQLWLVRNGHSIL